MFLNTAALRFLGTTLFVGVLLAFPAAAQYKGDHIPGSHQVGTYMIASSRQARPPAPAVEETPLTIYRPTGHSVR
jgi:hypothetical protein